MLTYTHSFDPANRSGQPTLDFAKDKGDSAALPPSILTRAEEILKTITPLTLAARDLQGRLIQLWKCQGRLIATVIDEKGKLTLVPGSHIYNATQEQENGEEVLKRLEKIGVRKWQFSYFSEKNQMGLWPCLSAGVINFTEDAWQIDHMFRNAKGHFSTDTPSNRQLIHETVNDRRYLKGPDRFGNDTFMKNHANGTQTWGKVNRAGRIIQGGLNENPLRWSYDFRTGTGTVIRTSKGLKALMIARRVKTLTTVVRLNPIGFILGEVAFCAVEALINYAFAEGVQQNGLTDSYNSCHSDSGIEKSKSERGEIGGVGNKVGLIKGLFDDYSSAQETEHIFYLPSSNGLPPIKDEILHQLIREVCEGVMVHDAVVFVSIHFDKFANLYCLVNRFFQKTLAGRVACILDYYLKGFLNGAFFMEAHVHEWQQTKTQDSEVLRQKLVDIHKLCQEKLGVAYYSMSELIEMYEAMDKAAQKGAPETPEPDILSDYSGFRSSFRIIAKQNSFKKAGNLINVDASFDALYTIKPDAVYTEALNKFRCQFGRDPAGYTRLVRAYEHMRHQIETMMPLLPPFDELFEMLKVINFFSYYFKTLKQSSKVPLLEPKTVDESFSCPPQFPHLPIRKFVRQEVKIQLKDALKHLTSSEQETFDRLIKQATDPSAFPQPLLDRLTTLIEAEVQKQASSLNLTKENSKLQSQQILKTFIKSLAPEETLETGATAKEKLETAKIEQDTLKKHIETGRTALKQRLEQQKMVEANLETLAKNLIHWEQKKVEANAASSWATPVSVQAVLKEVNENLQTIRTGIEEIGKFKLELEAIISSISSTLPLAEKELNSYSDQIANLTKGVQNPVAFSQQNSVFVGSVVQPTIQLFTEQSEEEKKQIKRIVGGCGLNLSNQTVVFDSPTQTILNDNYSDFIHLSDETLTPVKVDPSNPSSKIGGYAFKLPIRDFQASSQKDYGWISFLQNKQPPQETAVLQAELFSSALQEDLASFKTALSRFPGKSLVDCHGISLAHYAAHRSSCDYLTALVQAGFSLEGEDPIGYSALHYAAKAGSIANMEFLLKTCPSQLNRLSKNGLTPFYIAIQHRQLPAVKWLAAEGALINESTNYGMTPLYCAIHHEFEEIVEFLLGLTVTDVNASLEDGSTPLHLAIEMEADKIVQPLIERGADVNAARLDSYTPLHVASKKGNRFACQLLTQARGVNVQAQLKSGETALHLACRFYHFPIVSLLLEKGADPALFGWQKETALTSAVRNGHAEAVELILKQAKDKPIVYNDKTCRLVDFPDIQNKTPLTIALENRFYEIVDLLLACEPATPAPFDYLVELCKAKIDPLFLLDLMKRNKYDAQDISRLLQVSAESGHKDMLSSLRLSYPSADFKDEQGWSLAHYAAKYDLLNVIETLLPLNLAGLDKNRKTIVAIAAEHGSVRVLKLLLDRLFENKLPLTNHYKGGHLLLAAVESGELKSVDVMIDRLLHPNIVLDRQGRYAVHVAAKNGDVEMLDLLKLKGARFDVVDKAGQTAFHYSLDYEWEDATHYLFDKKHEFALPPNFGSFVAKKGSLARIEQLRELGHAFPVDQNREKQNDNHKQTLMHQYAVEADPKNLKELLKTNKRDLEAEDKQGITPLFYAIQEQLLDNVDLLLQAGANPNHLTYKRFSPLLFACEQNSASAAQALLKHGAHLNLPVLANRSSCLRYVIEKGHLELAQLLMTKGADLEQPDLFGTRPIHAIAAMGDLRFLRLAQAAGASLFTTDLDGKTIAHYAAKSNNPLLLDYLREQGVSFDTPNRLIVPSTRPSHPQTQGLVPLHIAAQEGQLAVMKNLADNGCDLEALDEQGLSALFYASQSGNKAALQFFLNYRLMNKTDQRAHAIRAAIFRDSVPQLKVFYPKNSFIDTPVSPDGNTALHFALLKGSKRCSSYLLGKGADAGRPASNGLTPIDLAIVNGHLEQARQAIQRTASFDPLHKDKEGKTYLHLACQHNVVEIAALLIELDADLNATDNEGWTALHYAAKDQREPLVRLLLAAGADLDQLTPDKKTAAQLIPVQATLLKNVMQAFRKQKESMIENEEGLLHLSIRMGDPTCFPLLLNREEIHHPNKQGRAPLHLAVNHKDPIFMRLLLNQDIDFELRDHQGETPLFFLAREGKELANARSLLELDARTQIENVKQETLLYTIAQRKDQAFAHRLFDLVYARFSKQAIDDPSKEMTLAMQNKDTKAFFRCVNAGHPLTGKNFSLLHLALLNNSEEIAKCLLVWFKMDANEKTKQGQLLIEVAIVLQRLNFVILFAEHVALLPSFFQSVYHPDQPIFKEMFKALHAAALKKAPQTPLTAQDARLFQQETTLPLFSLPIKGTSLEAKDKQGDSLLHLAARHNRLTMSTFLLWFGLDKEAVNDEGETCLHVAAKHRLPSMVKFLIEKEAHLQPVNKQGWTPLCLSLRQEGVNEEIIQMFKEKGVELQVIHEKQNQLQLAIQSNELNLFNNLLKLGLNPQSFSLKENAVNELKSILKQTNKTQWLAAYCQFACQNNHASMLADLRVLYLHAIKKSPTYIRSLYAYPAIVNMKDGHSPLCLAIEAGQTDTVKFLIGKNELANARDQAPIEHPLYLALKQNSAILVECVYRRLCLPALDKEQAASHAIKLTQAIQDDGLDLFIKTLTSGFDLLALEDKGRSFIELARAHKRERLENYLILLGAPKPPVVSMPLPIQPITKASET